jgi:DnaJ family protein A protein 5
MTTEQDLMQAMGKFRSNIDFSDSPNGFYGFVRETFEQLAKEEEYAADWEDVKIPDYPTFGHKDDSHDDVVREFYAAWNGFATVKSFAWMDRYRLSDAPDRRTRRAMEKENQKFRDDGRRDFNDAVRTLVAFVRKRDPRYKVDTKSADEKAKAQRDARKAQAARARAAQMAKLEHEAQALPSWATARPADEEEEETEEESEEELYECVACHKNFKSERQWDAHEKSKKHKKAIQALQWKMKKENANLNLDDDALSSDFMTPVEGADGAASDTNGLDESVEDITSKADELVVEDDVTDEDEYENSVVSEPQATHTAKVEEKDDEGESSDSDEDDEYASRSDIEARLNGPTPIDASVADTETATTEINALDEPQGDLTPQVPKLGKAKQKKAKKAAKQAEATDPETANKCLGCDAAFPSKTRLMKHLQDHPKHAALKSVPAKGKKKGKR